jgi:hypothetical protein
MPSSELPTLVRERGGRLVPFEPDKISESLYAATEKLGRPSAFLARELTDSVLHFLAREIETEPPSTAQIADLIVKVVRELGQPALAQVYAEGQTRHLDVAPPTEQGAVGVPCETAVHFAIDAPPAEVVRRCLRAYSLKAVFARDVAAAHDEGLVELGGLELPEDLASKVMDPPCQADSWLALLRARARTMIFDSPEFALKEEAAKPWLLGLVQCCQATGRTAVINLHAPPPAWAKTGAQGPLFEPPVPAPPGTSALVASLLLEELLRLDTMEVRVDWHLSEGDFAPENLPRLERLAGFAVRSANLGFALDRPKRPIALAAGADRRAEAVLLEVGLVLPHLLAMAGVDHDGQRFLEKLPSLARMALRAGVQKRSFLRRRVHEHPELSRGFLLERARLVVVPLGLDAIVRSLLGQSVVGSKLSLEFGRAVVETLQRTLQNEGKAANLDAVIDGPQGELAGVSGALNTESMHAAGTLHGIAGFGTLLVSGVTPAELVGVLATAWKKTDVVRLICGGLGE